MGKLSIENRQVEDPDLVALLERVGANKRLAYLHDGNSDFTSDELGKILDVFDTGREKIDPADFRQHQIDHTGLTESDFLALADEYQSRFSGDTKKVVGFFADSQNILSVDAGGPLELKGINRFRLNRLMAEQGYKMNPSGLKSLSQSEFIGYLIKKFRSKGVSRAEELSDILAEELRGENGLKYMGSLGRQKELDEAWYISNRQAICNSFARIYSALFDFFTTYYYPEFSGYKPLPINGQTTAVVKDDTYSHDYNVLLHKEGEALRVRLVDPTWRKKECTGERAGDFIFYLYKNRVITRDEALRVLDQIVVRDGDAPRKWALTNRIKIASEGAKSRSQEVELAYNYLNNIQNLTNSELDHALFLTIGTYVILGDRNWNGYYGSSAWRFASDVCDRLDEMIAFLSKKASNYTPRISAYIGVLNEMKKMGVEILDKINGGKIKSVEELKSDLEKLCNPVKKSRQNRAVITHLLRTGKIR